MSLKRRLSYDDPGFSPPAHQQASSTQCCEEPSSLRKRLRVSAAHNADQACLPYPALGTTAPALHQLCQPVTSTAAQQQEQQQQQFTIASLQDAAMAALLPGKEELLVEAVLKAGQGHPMSLHQMNALLRQLHFERLQRLAAAEAAAAAAAAQQQQQQQGGGFGT